MKKNLLLVGFVACYLGVSAQQFFHYMPIDSARLVIANAKTVEDKFYGYYGADRYYMSTGFFDSSELAQKEMFTIAENLNSDSLLCNAYAVMSNRYLLKQDFNYALIYVLKALEYAGDTRRIERVIVNASGLYAWSNDYETSLDYLKRLGSDAEFPTFRLFKDLYFDMAYNGLNQPDSALTYLQRTPEDYKVRPDPVGFANALGETARAYELKGDSDLANIFYKKSLQLCKDTRTRAVGLRIENRYSYYLLRQGNYAEARDVARNSIGFAEQVNKFTAIAGAAEVLQKVYTHYGVEDSAYRYALMQIAFKDSVSNQKRLTEFQNLTFGQKLKDIDEASKLKRADEDRQQNIQFALLALGIILFVILFLLLSRTVILNEKVISFFAILGLLVVFEFINLLIQPWLASFTHDSTVWMLSVLVLVAALLIPLHHRLEHWIRRKMIEKNKTILLAEAKKTI